LQTDPNQSLDNSEHPVSGEKNWKPLPVGEVGLTQIVADFGEEVEPFDKLRTGGQSDIGGRTGRECWIGVKKDCRVWALSLGLAG
jgi:hypothetical protein